MFIPLFLNVILRFSPDIELAKYPDYLNMFLYFVVLCISVKISNVFTCRPLEILLNIRFISILITQLIGFIGCLLFAYKLGSIFAIKTSTNKTSFTPFSRSFVIDFK
jgi:hypothetical protein